MSIVNDYYMQAKFAMAAYAELSEGEPDVSALESVVMVHSFASEFSNNY